MFNPYPIKLTFSLSLLFILLFDFNFLTISPTSIPFSQHNITCTKLILSFVYLFVSLCTYFYFFAILFLVYSFSRHLFTLHFLFTYLFLFHSLFLCSSFQLFLVLFFSFLSLFVSVCLSLYFLSPSVGANLPPSFLPLTTFRSLFNRSVFSATNNLP